MSELFGDYKRPKAEIKVINNFIEIYTKAKQEYKNHKYSKAIKKLNIAYNLINEVWDIYPKTAVLYLMIKANFKNRNYEECEINISRLENILSNLFQFHPKIFIKYKTKIFLYKFVIKFIYDDLENSVNRILEMISYIKNNEFFELENKTEFFFEYIKNFIKLGENIKSQKFKYFQEHYNNCIVEEIKIENNGEKEKEIKIKKINHEIVDKYKHYMNTKMRIYIYENLDKLFYAYKYGKNEDNKIMYFIQKNIDIYLKSDKKEKLNEKFNNFLLINKIDLEKEFHLTKWELINEQKRRIEAFNAIFGNLIGAFNYLFKEYFTKEEKKLKSSKSSFDFKENILNNIRSMRYDVQKKNNFDNIIIPSPETIHTSKINLLSKKFFLNKKIKIKAKNSLNIEKAKEKKPEIKNLNLGLINNRKIRRCTSCSIIARRTSSTNIISGLINNIHKNNKKSYYNESEFVFIQRNINYYLMSLLISLYEKIFNYKENYEETDINKNNKIQIFPNKKDLYNYNLINSIKEHSISEIKGNYSKENNVKNFFYQDFLLIKNFYFFGICEGHGTNGDNIAKSVSILLPVYIIYILLDDSIILKKQDLNSLIINLLKLEEPPSKTKNYILRYLFDKLEINYNYIPFISEKIQDIGHLLIESSNFIEKELVQRYHYDLEFSGATLTNIFLYGNILYISNIGNCKTIMCSYDFEKSKWYDNELTAEHIPENYDEFKRILMNDGKVSKLKNQHGKEIGKNLRIFENNKGAVFPGLKMSRTIGDFVAKKLGVINTPELFMYDLNKNDKFLIIGNDGFWSYMTNDEAKDIGGKLYEGGAKSEEIANKLVEVVKERWIEESQINYIVYKILNFHRNALYINKKGKKSLNDFSNFEAPQNGKKDFYEDISCIVVYLDIK